MTLIAQLSDTHITTGLGVGATDRAREAVVQVQATTPCGGITLDLATV